jgi:hypothetical protein
MFAKPRATSFIDNLIIEVREAFAMPLLFSLRNEDGKICCKTEKKITHDSEFFNWEGLNDLPYGVYTLECTQGSEKVETKIVKRI